MVFGSEHWTSGEDLSARVNLGWNERALYFGIRVMDDVFSQPAAKELLYLGDSVEIQLDTELLADSEVDTFDEDDWQIGFSPEI